MATHDENEAQRPAQTGSSSPSDEHPEAVQAPGDAAPAADTPSEHQWRETPAAVNEGIEESQPSTAAPGEAPTEENQADSERDDNGGRAANDPAVNEGWGHEGANAGHDEPERVHERQGEPGDNATGLGAGPAASKGAGDDARPGEAAEAKERVDRRRSAEAKSRAFVDGLATGLGIQEDSADERGEDPREREARLERENQQREKAKEIGRSTGRWAGTMLGSVTGFISMLVSALVRSFRRASDRLMGTSLEASAEKAKAEKKEAIEAQNEIRQNNEQEKNKLSEREYGLEQRKNDLDTREASLAAREAELATNHNASRVADREGPAGSGEEGRDARIAGFIGGGPAGAEQRREAIAQLESQPSLDGLAQRLKNEIPTGGFALLDAVSVWDKGSWVDGSVADRSAIDAAFASNGGREALLSQLGNGSEVDHQQVAKAVFEVGLMRMNDDLGGSEPSDEDLAALWVLSQGIAENVSPETLSEVREDLAHTDSVYDSRLGKLLDQIPEMDLGEATVRLSEEISKDDRKKALAAEWVAAAATITTGFQVIDTEPVNTPRAAAVNPESAQPDEFNSPTNSDAELSQPAHGSLDRGVENPSHQSDQPAVDDSSEQSRPSFGLGM